MTAFESTIAKPSNNQPIKINLMYMINKINNETKTKTKTKTNSE